MTRSLNAFATLCLAFCLMLGGLGTSGAQTPPPQSGYTMDEVINTGHSFFGSTSGGLAQLVQRAIQDYGLGCFCRRPALRRRHALHQKRRQSPDLLARSVRRPRFRRRRRTDHDARL